MDDCPYDREERLIGIRKDAAEEAKANWSKKSKGNAKIYTHPDLAHSIVENYNGIFFMGQSFNTVDAAKEYAERRFLHG